ncbi:MAG: hypothetical protein Q7T30_03335 [Planctomycetota bacterium]|nr:hypothetical protein [Planctomycetota bacterium]
MAGEPVAACAATARIARHVLQQLQNANVPNSGLRFGGDWQFFYYQFDTNDPIN